MVPPDRLPQPQFRHQSAARSSSPLVGRSHELIEMRVCLEAALGGHGSLILVGGEAGIGKTSLVGTITREALEQNILLLSGHCYDLTATPPYGPWVDALHISSSADVLDAARTLFRNPAEFGDAQHQGGLFEQIWNIFAALATMQPLVLVLEDLHWSDPASLDLLRFIARRLSDVPILLLATYRDDELTRHHLLYQLLPILVREAQTERIDLRRLDEASIRELVAGRYPLADGVVTSLVTYLQGHTEGNPFFLTEVLRTLEGERLLYQAHDVWHIGELANAPVPPLVRQVIEGRLARLDDSTRSLLELAAMIGQVTPFDLWQTVSQVGSDVLLDGVEQAIEAHLLESNADGTSARFTHALIREAIYESISPPRRRYRHRQIGDALAATHNPNPDEVAHHFQQVGDPRAIDWLILAGERAQRTYAWTTASERFETAARLMDGDCNRAGERAWLLNRLGMSMRWTNPERGAAYLEESARIAESAGDRELAAHARAYHGLLLCFTGKVRQGIAAMERAVADLDTLAPDQRRDVAGGVNPAKGALALWLGIVGRYRESADKAKEVLAELTRHEIHANAFTTSDIGTWDRSSQAGTQVGSACLALARSLSMLGQPDEAQPRYVRSAEIYTALKHFGMVYTTRVNELWELTMPCQSDELSHRAQVATAMAMSWTQAQGAMRADVSPRIMRLPLLVIEGDWADMRDLTVQFRQAHGNVTMHLRAMTALGTVARAQGDSELAWNQIREGVAFGPDHEPGDTEFLSAAMLQRLAVALALDAGDLPLARAWLEASDRWLAWSNAVLGQAEVALLWATYLEATGERVMARERAEESLVLAGQPRQPLVLLAIQRYLGQLATVDGRHSDAEHDLAKSLTLADRCAAPFERAATLVALAELHIATGQHDEALALLDEARAICTLLAARPTLGRIDALHARIGAGTITAPAYPDRLTPREVEVLRLIAAGRSNREIADALFLSTRTVERHIANIYLKIDAHSKADATAYAFRNNLVDEPATPT